MKLLVLLFLLLLPVTEASAMDLTAPPVPDSGSQWMPDNTESFGEGLWELAENALSLLRPELKEAAKIGVSVLATALFLSLIRCFLEKHQQAVDFAGTACIAVLLWSSSNAMIRLGMQTVRELCSYGKLLFPVMTSAMAAQGAPTTSAALYVGTSVLDLILGSLLSDLLLPGISLFLAVAVTYAATGEPLLKRIREAIKKAVSWCLKTILTVFTTYMSITGVVSGTTDAAALKAAKVTISSVVPVVGGILSDASEAVLSGAGFLKNAAGIYGILALLAIFLEPFLKIGVQYLVLKVLAVLCLILEGSALAELLEDLSSAMGLLLAITGSVCVLQLISTVCFMKGFG